MRHETIAQLKKLRTEPRAGYAGEELRARSREKFMEAITTQQEQTSVWAPSVAFEFIQFAISDILAKPVTALASFVILVLGGLTTVSAASQSLPGDTLYSVKLVSERAQLQLTRADKKAILHTEFAERRLQELVELTSGATPDKILVTNTADAFKREVQSATQEIQHLQETQSIELLEQVSEVNAKMSELTDSLTQTPITDEPSLTDDIQGVTESAQNTVVDTVVDTHEKTPEPASGRELADLFQTRMNRLIQRRTHNIGRIEVIESNKAFARVSSRAQTGIIKAQLETASKQVFDASSFAVAGGYRKAFEVIREAEIQMNTIENTLADIEIQLIEKNEMTTTEIVPPIMIVVPEDVQLQKGDAITP